MFYNVYNLSAMTACGVMTECFRLLIKKFTRFCLSRQLSQLDIIVTAVPYCHHKQESSSTSKFPHFLHYFYSWSDPTRASTIFLSSTPWLQSPCQQFPICFSISKVLICHKNPVNFLDIYKQYSAPDNVSQLRIGLNLLQCSCLSFHSVLSVLI